MSRSTISRREPVIALESFRYRGRNYKEGGYLDRRRTRMPHSKLVRLLREGVCILAKNVNPEKLAEYGFTYNPENPRMKLNRLSKEENLKRKNDLEMEKYFNDDESEVEEEIKTEIEDNPEVEDSPEDEIEDDASSEPTLKHSGGGWYDVMVDGVSVNPVGLRKDDAKEFIANYKVGE